MNESLIHPQRNTSETRQESLTRQFYEWEQRGRGWQLRPFPLALEPPFRPFYLFDTVSEQAVDDGRKPTFFSKLIENFCKTTNADKVIQSQSSASTAYGETLPDDADEPAVCDYYDEDFTEIQIILPRDLRISKAVSEQLLLSLGYCSHPVSFEIIGSPEQIIVQMASTTKDAAQLKQQLKAHFPQSILSESSMMLSDVWEDGGDYEVVADFGLSKEFMLPLNPVGNFEVDPLVAVVGALSGLQADEVGVFQILFQKARFDWAEEIMDSVRFYDGTPFFVNAPEMISLAQEKVSRPLFAACVRVAAKSYVKERMWQIVSTLR